jgi:hypothetical protein
MGGGSGGGGGGGGELEGGRVCIAMNVLLIKIMLLPCLDNSRHSKSSMYRYGYHK